MTSDEHYYICTTEGIYSLIVFESMSLQLFPLFAAQET